MISPQSILARFGYATVLFATSAIATVVGAVVGTVIVFVLLNFFGLVAILLKPAIVGEALAQGAMFAAPLTFGFLPLSAVALRKRRLALQLLLPAVGLVGGGLTMWIWSIMQLKAPGPGSVEVLVVTGAIAGLAAGVLYGHVMAEERA